MKKIWQALFITLFLIGCGAKGSDIPKGYISKNEMIKSDLVDFVIKLHEDFPWLIDCEDKMDVTVIADIFDVKQLILDSKQESSERPQLQNLEVEKKETPKMRLPSSKPTRKSPKL